MRGICPITKCEDDIRKSHIYPKFLWKHLKRTGGTVFRSVDQPTKELQNGLILNLLGSKAEQMFSKREMWFEKNLFTPYVNQKLYNKKLNYTKDLYYFAISLLWRVLYIHQNSINRDDLKTICLEALEDWRSYLNQETKLPRIFSNIYIMPVSPKLLSLPYGDYDIDSYLMREFDDNVMYARNSKDSAIFCKIPHFIIWGQLVREDQSINYGLKINPCGGKFDLKKFSIGYGLIRNHICQQIEISAKEADRVSKGLSEKSQNSMLKRFKDNIDHIKGSEMGNLLLERTQ